MTASANRIQDLLLRIQSEFLENPSLSLTLPAAEQWFGVDEATCAGVLGALADARVLIERDGAYRKYFPRSARRAA